MDRRVIIEQGKMEAEDRLYVIALGFVFHGWQIILTERKESHHD